MWNANLAMPPQFYGWTCSSCSLDWVIRASYLEPDYNRIRAVHEIGYPEQINPQVGLTNANGPGQALIDVYASYGQRAEQAYLSFDEVYQLAQQTTGQMSGANWYHWVALRGVVGADIWIANSAPGYKGIFDRLSRYDFDRLGGFSVVWLTE